MATPFIAPDISIEKSQSRMLHCTLIFACKSLSILGRLFFHKGVIPGGKQPQTGLNLAGIWCYN